MSAIVLPRLLVSFTAYDVPDDVQREVFRLLLPYDPDIYERAEQRPARECQPVVDAEINGAGDLV